MNYHKNRRIFKLIRNYSTYSCNSRSSGTERILGPYGSIGETPFNVSGYILGFRGYELESINALSVYYLPPLFRSPSSYGSSIRGYAYDDNVNVLIPPVVGIHNYNCAFWLCG